MLHLWSPESILTVKCDFSLAWIIDRIEGSRWGYCSHCRECSNMNSGKDISQPACCSKHCGTTSYNVIYQEDFLWHR